jgi:hypothetical protein
MLLKLRSNSKMFSRYHDEQEEQEDIIKCHICKSPLIDDEMKCYYRIKETSPETIVCQKHWCSCLPVSTPYRYTFRCELCNESIICKSCYCYLNPQYGSVCQRCKKIGDKLLYGESERYTSHFKLT